MKKISFSLSALLIFLFITCYIFLLKNIPDHAAYKILYESMSFKYFNYPYFTIGGITGRETLFASAMAISNQFLRFELFYAIISAALFVSLLSLCRELVARENVFAAYTSFLSFFSINFFVISIRNGIILLMFLYAVVLYKKRRQLGTFVTLLLAHMIHFMGVVLPFIFLTFKGLAEQKTRYFTIIILVISILIIEVFFQYFTGKFGYSGYLLNQNQKVSVSIYLIFIALSLLALFFFKRKYIFEIYSPLVLLSYNLLFLISLKDLGVLFFRFLPIFGGISLITCSVILLSLVKRSLISNLTYILFFSIIFYQINFDRDFYLDF